MDVPMLDLSPQNDRVRDPVLRRIERIIDTGAFVLGREVEAFERELAEWCGARHAIGVSSGTDAMLVALMALEVGPGDEVIVPAFTFFATAGVVHRLGATPVFADIDPATFNVDPGSAEQAITDRTRAILPVHLFGQCAEMGPLGELADRHGLAVVEDAAQAIGARDGQRQAGTMSHFGALSFYPTKNLSAFGDAGALLTDDDALAERARQLRVHGQSDAYRHERVGGNFRIDAIQAAVLREKLRFLSEWIAARGELACRYHGMLGETPVSVPHPAENKHHVYNQYTIRADRRDALADHLRQRGIGCRVYYPMPLHTQPCFASPGYEEGRLPEAERACRQVLSLPMYPGMPADHQQRVAEAIAGFYDGP